jgi:protein SCO1
MTLSIRAVLAILLATSLVAPPAGSAPGDPPTSIYQLDAALVDQEGRAHSLDVHRGHPVLLTFFYGGCQATCPLIIDTLRATEKQAAPAQRADLRVLLITIDPEHDTTAALAEIARARRIDTTRWTLARTDEATVRKIAALVGLQYRRLPDGEFNHSTVIALLSPRGQIEERSSGLGRVDERLLAKLRADAR